MLTIGNFDGVHLGHRRILQAARSLADARRSAVTAVTFDPPPDLVLRPNDVPQRITPREEKCRLLRDAGADWVVTLRSDRALLEMAPQDFIDQIVLRRFEPAFVVEGPNFFFGRGRQGTLAVLTEAGRCAGFVVHAVEPLVMEIGGKGERVSSSLIRRLLAAGLVEQANRCLGREFVLCGRVVGGFRRGRLLDYPTANLDPGQQIAPGDGVYAGRASVRDGLHPAAISIGDNPTFGPTERTIEAFLLNAEGDFYDESIALSFICRLRDQERFDGREALKDQIAKDVKRVREICG